jgi:hypothetical protein
VLVDVDVSGSQTDEKLRQDFGVLDEVVAKVLPRGSRLAMWSYDYDAERYYDGRPSRPQDLRLAEKDMLDDRRRLRKQHPLAPNCKCQTRLSRALKESFELLQRQDADGVPSTLILLTDGEVADRHTAHGLANQLAALKHLKAVWVVGVMPGTLENLPRQVHHIFGSVGERLIVSERHDRLDGLQDFKKLVRE